MSYAKLEQTFDWLHRMAPAPFNPDSCGEAYGKAVSQAYAEWCEAHPDSTQEGRKAAYAELSDQIAPRFPTARERGLA